MCLRVFVSAARPLCSTEPGPAAYVPGRVLSLRPLDPALTTVRALLGEHAIEAGAHTGCACGFNAGAVSWTSRATRREELVGLEGGLTPDERDDLEQSALSCRALVEVLAPHVHDGNVRVLVTWYGEEDETPVRAPAKRLVDLTSELEPFPNGVVFDVIA